MYVGAMTGGTRETQSEYNLNTLCLQMKLQKSKNLRRLKVKLFIKDLQLKNDNSVNLKDKTESDKVETKNQRIEPIKQKVGSLKKINKINKPLTKLFKRESISEGLKLKTRKGATTDSREVQRISRNTLKPYIQRKNLNEMDRFLNTNNPMRSPQSELTTSAPKNGANWQIVAVIQN